MRGSAHIDVHAGRVGGDLVLAGTVLDDAARPALGAQVTVAVARATQPQESIALAASAARACGGAGPAPELRPPGQLVLTTDEVARFCVRVTLAADRYVARIESGRSGLVDNAWVELPFDLAFPPVTLRFDPERSVLSLDDDATSVDVVASTDDDGVTTSARGLVLSLSNEARALATATTDAAGRARFTVDGARLGPPGKGELRAAFAGSAGAGATGQTMAIERRTRVDIVAPDAAGPRLPIGCPEDGITVRLITTPRCRGCTGSPSGMIEARVGARAIVGAAPVSRGEARVPIAFASLIADRPPNESATEVPVTFRFIADAPWFEPAGALVLLQPVRGSSLWRRAPLVFAAGLVVAWLALTRLPVQWRRQRTPARRGLPTPVGERFALVRKAKASEGWTGYVTDAQDGVAIPHARVAIERRGFGGIDLVSETTCDASGHFTLLPLNVRPGDELVAEGPLHAASRHPLPSSGELAVSLVLRKRALVDRLVDWARRQGGPYVALPDPTPGHVRRAAGTDASIARWATAVERAAYGDHVVDEHIQADVDRLAPFDDRR